MSPGVTGAIEPRFGRLPRLSSNTEPIPTVEVALRGSREDLQLKDGFKKSLSMLGEVGSLAGDRVVSHERSRPADLHDDKIFDRDTRALILRIIVVACLAVLFWHTVVAAGRL